MEDTVGSEKRKRKERCGIREELLERGDEIKSEEKRLIEGSVRIGEESIQEQTPVIQSPPSTLLPSLEISYSPVSNLFPDFFDDLFPSSPPPVLHLVSPPIEELSISHTTPSIPHVQTDTYSTPGHFPLFFHAHQLLEYMSYFIPCTNDRVIVSAGSSCLFSIPIPSHILIDPLSFRSYDFTQF
ncbi:hypothetical protein ALC56_06695 [Trachymyrmex septentrionalis]|uniref:Uncharacterized protein n=1 Tax=Trachymyrmex septentrionalis TaxID=34720 RepID=A0A151JWN1_9HYME|nr:hypothetical protein ALC56_06695 [Trachymyrmex septentrionalis]